MNEVIRQARGELIVRMDVHCEYAPSYVRACVDVMRRTGADNVGGAQRSRAETRFQRALTAALSSPLGVGGSAYRSAEKEGYVDTVFLGAFRRSVFESIGLYDEGAVTNEDAELNQRLLDAGGKIYLSPEIEVHYTPRDSLRKLAVQYFRYGKGRSRSVLKHGPQSPQSAAPFLLVVGGAVLLATSRQAPVGEAGARRLRGRHRNRSREGRPPARLGRGADRLGDLPDAAHRTRARLRSRSGRLRPAP